MSEYVTQSGDTFERIARQVYGVGTASGILAEANPGITDNLTEGISLFIPEVFPDSPVNEPAENPDEIAIIIDGERFRFWTDATFTVSIDGISSVQFLAPFDPNDAAQREKFRPFSYSDVVVTIGGSQAFKGTMIGTDPDVSPSRSVIAITAYAKAGVLNDCTMPASAYPIEFDNTTLKDIAIKLTQPFGVPVTFDADPGPAFERVALQPGQIIFTFLAELAKQRNLVISTDERGGLVFKQSIGSGLPVANLEDNAPPVVSVRSRFEQQRYFSDITGIEPVILGFKGSQFTVKNSLLKGRLRPHTFTVNDVEGGVTQAAVEAKAGRMFGSMVVYLLEVNTWRDPSGKLWAPNTIIKLFAPNSMIYSAYDFLIREVKFFRTSSDKLAALTLVFPGSYEGKIPEALPWD